jgi:hypothetical protein
VTAPPLVSVITPTYNHEAYVGGAIASVRAQTFGDWEHIVVDDGSADGTWSVVTEHAAQDARIRAFRQEHRGLGRLHETYNFALDEARGTFVAILEGDDVWSADKLAIQTHHCREDLVLSYGHCVSFASDPNDGQRLTPPPFTGCVKMSVFRRELLLGRAAVQPVTLMVRRSALDAVGGFSQDGFYAVDLPTLLRLSERDGEVAFIEHLLGFWRLHSAQVTQRTFAPGDATVDQGGRLAHRAEATLVLQLDSLRRAPVENLSTSALVSANAPGLADAYLVALSNSFATPGFPRGEFAVLIRGLWKYGGPLRRAQAVYAQVCVWTRFPYAMPFRAFERVILSRRTA